MSSIASPNTINRTLNNKVQIDNLFDLSDDIINKVLQCMNGRDLAHVGCVNQHFHQLCSNPNLWKNLALHKSQWYVL